MRGQSWPLEGSIESALYRGSGSGLLSGERAFGGLVAPAGLHRGGTIPSMTLRGVAFTKGLCHAVLRNADSGVGLLVFESSCVIYWVCNFG